MTKIIVTHENGDIEKHDFEMEIKTISIGRRSTNDVCIPNLSVSGTHAQLTITDDGSGMLEDLGSTNGTYINSRLISRQRLAPDDDIVMGKVRLKVTLVAQPENLRPAGQAVSAPLDNDADQTRPRSNQAKNNRVVKDSPRQDQQTDKPAAGAEPVARARTQLRAVDKVSENLEADNSDEHDFSLPDRYEKSETPMNSAADVHDDSGDYGDVLQRSAAVVNADRAAKPAGNSAEPALRPVAERPSAIKPPGGAANTASAKESELDHELENKPRTTAGAVIEIKNGAKSGQVLPIDKPVTTLGRPGIQIAAIMKKPDGYFLMHIESDDNVEPPRLNSSTIGDEPVLLKSGDALNVAGIDVQFMLS